jgi:hypothetical protein
MDIRIDHSLPSKPEVLQISARLGVSVSHAVGCLTVCWLWTDQVSVGGSLNHSPEVIDQITGMPGMAAAMEEVGWLIQEDGGFCLPRISRYTGDGRTTRERRLVQQAKSKSQKRSKTGQFSRKTTKNPTVADGVTSFGGGIPNHPSVVRPSQPGPARPDPTQPEQIQTGDVIECDHIGDGDFTGETISPSRFYSVSSMFGKQIDMVLSSIPSSRRRQPVKTKRAIAAAIDRGVDADSLACKISDYYNSDEGSGEYATWPANWIDQERYEEDPSAWERSTEDKSINLEEIL